MVRYVNGNVAVDFAAEELEQEELQERPDRRFTVLPGSRPEGVHREQTQTAISPLLGTILRCAAACVAVFVVVGLARVLLISMAFGYSAQNAQLNTELEDARSLGSELEVRQSVNASADRITSLAIDAYGMVPADSVAVLDLTVAAAADVSAAGDMANVDGGQTE